MKNRVIKIAAFDYFFLQVFIGSASEGILYPGDKLASINYQDATKLTHLQAQNVMKSAGTSVKLDVARPGLQEPRGSFESQGRSC